MSHHSTGENLNNESKKVENCLMQSIEISGILPVNAALRYGMDTVDSVIAILNKPEREEHEPL